MKVKQYFSSRHRWKFKCEFFVIFYAMWIRFYVTSETSEIVEFLSTATNNSSVTDFDSQIHDKIIRRHEVLHVKNSSPRDGSCEEGRPYTSLEFCMKDCERRKQDLLDSIYTIKIPFSYKVLLLTPDEYELPNDSELYILKKNIKLNNNSYVLFADGTVRACLPLFSKFASCLAWGLKPKEIQFDKDGQTMWVKKDQQKYEWDEFFLYNKHAFTCIPDKNLQMGSIGTAYFVASLMSVAFLCLLFLLSKIINELQRNYILQCHMIMLIMAFTVQSIRFGYIQRTETFCIVFGALQQFFFLSAFLWTNIQSYDLFVAFKRIKAPKKLTLRKFLCHSAVCWGLPVVLAVISVVTEILEVPYLKPEFKTQCWYHFGLGIAFFYLYGWMALSILINIIFFILIIIIFRRMSQEISKVNRNAQKQLFQVTIKLVIVMGFCWIFKIFAWMYGSRTSILWYFDVAANFQGVFIFLVYTCKANFIRKIFEKLKSVCKIRKHRKSVGSYELTGSTLSVATTVLNLE